MHHRNNGFLNYWTISNSPLFLIALPVLVLMLITSVIATVEPQTLLSSVQNSDKMSTSTAEDYHCQKFIACMRLFALPQATLAILALFNFHVQIINRLSSGYPVWYMVIALAATSRDKCADGTTGSDDSGRSQTITRKLARSLRKRGVQHVLMSSMILYAVVQAGLYASFLPPA